ncbi:hypothetical protein ACHHYP_16543 [Achlya hypogyna]|uniref:3'-5' exonuclease domain-containing protein n=1 Tax=Achlya hypogyna TaxID=1202772 RepID=A0A1V9ZE82_ACHHY|nr:hypothetical protein ACHHYP_16543 [Achlya hypogyna]
MAKTKTKAAASAPVDETPKPTLEELMATHAGAHLDLVPLVAANDIPSVAARIDFLLCAGQRMLLHEELARALSPLSPEDAISSYLALLEHTVLTNSEALATTMTLLPLVVTGRSCVLPPPVVERATIFFQNHLELKAANTSHTGAFCEIFNVPVVLRAQRFQEWLLLDSVAALKFLQSTNLAPHVDTDAALEYLIAQTHYNAADALVVHVPALQRPYVQALVDGYVDAKIVKKRITRFGFEPDDFPAFVARRRRATIRYLVKAGQFGDVDEAIGGDAAAKKFACHLVYDTCGADSPVTRQFLVQYGLASSFPDVVIDAAAAATDISLLMDDPPRLEGFAAIGDFLEVDRIVFVATPAALAAVAPALLAAPFVGLDCEWRASYNSFTSTSSAGNPCALLQLATATHVYLVDMLVPGMLEPLLPWFAAPHSLKLGFDIKADLMALQAPKVCGVVDLQSLAKRSRLLPGRSSLSDLALHFLGRPLDKRVRMSNWERRPLTAMQQEYAALDAYVLVCAYDELVQDPALAAAAAECRYDRVLPET